VGLVNFLEKGEISHLAAKTVLKEMLDTGLTAREVIKNKNLSQVSDAGSLQIDIEEVIKSNPHSIADYKKGKDNAVMFLVGQVMKRTKGKANPKVVQEILKRRLKDA
jgi:aspartyl-tRNA(Asn)/glutamyl-tRNA(Gln) amidotransferase subunit B